MNPRVSRRRFLEDSLLAAAATLGAMQAGSAAPDEAPPSLTPRAGANSQVRMACVGVHGRGMAHVNGYMGQKDATVAAICDVDSHQFGHAVKAVEDRGGMTPATYQDIRKLLENKDIDAVSLALPIHWEALASIWAMQAGKDVYVEKPVCHNIWEGQRMIEAAAKYGRIVQAGTQSRSNRAVQQAIAYIHEGKIGKVTLSRGLCYKPRGSIGIFPDSAVPAGVDYDIWLGPAPKRPFNRNRFHYNWHWNWDYGAGDLGNQGIHQMDIARWALNRDDLPKSVWAAGGRFGYVDQGETPNTDVVMLDYGDQHLIFEVRGLKTDGIDGVSIGDIVYGPDGYVAFTANYGHAAAFDNDHKPVKQFSGGGDHFGNFIQAVKSRKVSSLHAPLLEGYHSTVLCHLGNISYRLGDRRPFTERPTWLAENKDGAESFDRMQQHLQANDVSTKAIPYQLGRFLKLNGGRFEDDQANAMLTRHYREPFVVPEQV